MRKQQMIDRSPRRNHGAVRRYACLLAILGLAAGCGSSSPQKQAEELGSVAAEGALIAHDASEGDTTDAFTRVHSRALREQADSIERQAADARLARLGRRIAGALDRLADDPGDQDAAALIQRELERAADEAGELEQQA